jgi:hypothetical protein
MGIPFSSPVAASEIASPGTGLIGGMVGRPVPPVLNPTPEVSAPEASRPWSEITPGTRPTTAGLISNMVNAPQLPAGVSNPTPPVLRGSNRPALKPRTPRNKAFTMPAGTRGMY